jgi:hypothetical protein
MKKWNLLAASAVLFAALAGCGSAPVVATGDSQRWNDGVWNSVLGYHGPANVLVSGAP